MHLKLATCCLAARARGIQHAAAASRQPWRTGWGSSRRRACPCLLRQVRAAPAPGEGQSGWVGSGGSGNHTALTFCDRPGCSIPPIQSQHCDQRVSAAPGASLPKRQARLQKHLTEAMRTVQPHVISVQLDVVCAMEEMKLSRLAMRAPGHHCPARAPYSCNRTHRAASE